MQTAAEAFIVDVIRRDENERGGWLRFDEFINIALHHPQHGYYGSGRVRFGEDFYTAPTISPLFGETLAQVIAPIIKETRGSILELGAGDGQLALHICESMRAMGNRCDYEILETAPALRERQQARLAAYKDSIRWRDTLPESHRGVIIANEVLDCTPFRLYHYDGEQWCERGVCINNDSDDATPALTFCDKPTTDNTHDFLLARNLPAGYTTEISEQASALCRALCDSLQAGVLLLADYGFGRDEYYHPQRTQGTLMCHYAQQMDTNPLANIGQKDITTHVDFTAIAAAGHSAGAQVLGYTNQASFLINGGILNAPRLQNIDSTTKEYAQHAAAIHRLTAPQEMGELFKWLSFSKTDSNHHWTLPAFQTSHLHRL